jgi:3-oxo-5-alpha-steroid 4-dehydrogenase 1
MDVPGGYYSIDPTLFDQPLYIAQFVLLGIIFFIGLTTMIASGFGCGGMDQGVSYGRYSEGKASWADALPEINLRLGWFLMESPSSIFFAVVFGLQYTVRWSSTSTPIQPVPIVLFLLWELHYFHRTFIYPLQIRASTRKHKMAIVASGFFYNIMNAYVNATFIARIGVYPISYFADPRFIIGVVVFLFGYFVVHQSDAILINLRKSPATKTNSAITNEGGLKAPGDVVAEGAKEKYKIPYGGMFRFVSCPNFFGECTMWLGWAIAAWSLEGFSFFFVTCSNLIPRAITHHRWYKEKFGDAYPARRKAFLPFVF